MRQCTFFILKLLILLGSCHIRGVSEETKPILGADPKNENPEMTSRYRVEFFFVFLKDEI